MSTVLSGDKSALRAQAIARRREAHQRHGARAGQVLADHGLAFLGASTQTSAGVRAAISGFSAINDEIDPLPLLMRLQAEGHALALPVMQGKGQPLVMRSWTPGDDMAPAVWGIAEPLPSREALDPDIVLVPLLAFDGTGHRLGYGGGFYDRTLHRLRRIKLIITVGIAYDEQRLDAVPHLDYDQLLDWVLTPSGPIKCSTDKAAP